MIVNSETPFNAETPLDRLREQFVTSRRDFCVGSHGPVPRLAVDSHTVTIRYRIETAFDLLMRALRSAFPVRSVTAVIQCAGNPRTERNRVRRVSGELRAAECAGQTQSCAAAETWPLSARRLTL
jgi:sulfite oxidase